MSKKIKQDKISVNTIEKYYKANRRSVVYVTFGEGDDQFSVSVKPIIDISTFAAAVEAAVSPCFDDDGHYVAWIKPHAFRHAVLAAYTNLTLPSSLEKEYMILSGSTIYDKVEASIDEAQLFELEEAVNDQIEYKLDEIADSRKQELDQAIVMLKLVTHKYDELINLCNNVIGGDIKDLAERLKSSAGNVTSEVQAIREKVLSFSPESGGEKS